MCPSFLQRLRRSITRIAAPGLLLLLTAAPYSAQSRDLNIKSPNHRYAVRFSDPRSDAADAGRLWGRITVRDLQTGRETTTRVAAGQRGQRNFEGFSRYEQT